MSKTPPKLAWLGYAALYGAAVGMAAVKGTLLITLGTMISRAAERFINWWGSSAEKPAKSKDSAVYKGVTPTGINKGLGCTKIKKPAAQAK